MPPVTPAPSRFLVKKPSTQQSQNQTLNSPFAQGSGQFQATPRFATSTPRPRATQAGAAITTPALAFKPTVRRTRATQDIIDDSSPVSPGDGSPPASPDTRVTLPEPIEPASSLVPQSSPGYHSEGRSPKRRRISIASSEAGVEPLIDSPQLDEPYLDSLPDPVIESDLGSLPDASDDHIASYHTESDDNAGIEHSNAAEISPIQSTTSSPGPHTRKAQPGDGGNGGDSHAENSTNEPNTPPYPKRPKPPFRTPRPPTTDKPVFRHPPRFKLADPSPDIERQPPQHQPRFKLAEPPTDFPSPAATAYLTADIFSPRRRGAEYLAGGLAAEFRDWLVDVKGGVDGEGETKAASSVLGLVPATAAVATTSVATAVRVRVEEVSGGGLGMTMVAGRLVVGDGVAEGGLGEGRVRVILAGEGEVEGLSAGRGGGKREGVRPGAVVAVAPPAWDVELEDRWAVAYRWEVVEGAG